LWVQNDCNKKSSQFKGSTSGRLKRWGKQASLLDVLGSPRSATCKADPDVTSDSIDPQAAQPAESDASDSVDDQMKAFETLQRNRLVRADEHNSRMKSVSNKISLRFDDDGKKAAVQATQASVDSF
jgi:hypothetical protein